MPPAVTRYNKSSHHYILTELPESTWTFSQQDSALCPFHAARRALSIGAKMMLQMDRIKCSNEGISDHLKPQGHLAL